MRAEHGWKYPSEAFSQTQMHTDMVGEGELS